MTPRPPVLPRAIADGAAALVSRRDKRGGIAVANPSRPLPRAVQGQLLQQLSRGQLKETPTQTSSGRVIEGKQPKASHPPRPQLVGFAHVALTG